MDRDFGTLINNYIIKNNLEMNDEKSFFMVDQLKTAGINNEVIKLINANENHNSKVDHRDASRFSNKKGGDYGKVISMKR